MQRMPKNQAPPGIGPWGEPMVRPELKEQNMGPMGPMGLMGMKAEPMGARGLPSMKQGLSLGKGRSPLTKSSLDIAKQHQSKMNQGPTPGPNSPTPMR